MVLCCSNLPSPQTQQSDDVFVLQTETDLTTRTRSPDDLVLPLDDTSLTGDVAVPRSPLPISQRSQQPQQLQQLQQQLHDGMVPRSETDDHTAALSLKTDRDEAVLGKDEDDDKEDDDDDDDDDVENDECVFASELYPTVNSLQHGDCSRRT